MSDLATKQKRFATLLDEINKIDTEYKGKPMPPNVGEELEGKAKEAEDLQREIDALVRPDQTKKITDLNEWSRKVPDQVPLPTATKDVGGNGRVAGYISLGTAVVLSEEYKKYVEAGTPRGNVRLFSPDHIVAVKGSKELYVPLTGEERKRVEELAIEMKAVPTIGTGVIDAARLDVMPQVTADDRLVLRDILTVGRTNSASVEYVREESFTRAAAPTAHGAVKPEAAVEYSLQTAAVRTIAVWIPAQVQQLSDWAQLRTLIDARLRYDLQKTEEEQVIYGSGVAPNLEGIMTVTGTTDIAALARYAAGTDTLIDVVRMGITEVVTAGYSPNGVVIHPIDWETIVLEKGTDDRYVWAVVTDENGSRIWGLRVVESVGAEENAGVATEARNLIVGDFARGAMLLVREDISVSVGLKDDDFIRNLRTILAEERVAFPIFAPAAFATFETQAASAS